MAARKFPSKLVVIHAIIEVMDEGKTAEKKTLILFAPIEVRASSVPESTSSNEWETRRAKVAEETIPIPIIPGAGPKPRQTKTKRTQTKDGIDLISVKTALNIGGMNFNGVIFLAINTAKMTPKKEL